MKLAKDGKVLNLENENHVSAFLSEGWTEYKEPELKAEAPEAKPTPKKATTRAKK